MVSDRSKGTPFDDREKAAEAHYRLEQLLAFKTEMRRARLAGLWAGERMGQGHAQAQDYAAEIVGIAATMGVGKARARLALDLGQAGCRAEQDSLEGRFETFLVEARRQVMDDLAAGRIKLD